MQEPEKNHPTAAQFAVIKAQLTYIGSRAYFNIDGYFILAEVTQVNRSVKIVVYVNGWIKGSWCWHGQESDLETMPDIPRKFYCLTKKGYSKKEIEKWVKVYGGIKKAKAAGIYNKNCYTYFNFSSAGAFITHIKKHNRSIEIIDYAQYKEGLAQLKEALNQSLIKPITEHKYEVI